MIDNVKVPQNWGPKYYLRSDDGVILVIVNSVCGFIWLFLEIYTFECVVYPGTELPVLSLSKPMKLLYLIDIEASNCGEQSKPQYYTNVCIVI